MTIIFTEGKWLNQKGQILDETAVANFLLELENQLKENYPALSQLVIKAIYYAIGTGQDLTLTLDVLNQLTPRQADFLEEFLEDVLADLDEVQEDLTATVAEIEELVVEKTELEEDYMEGLSDLETASPDLLDSLSAQVLAVTELDKEIGEMMAERSRLSAEQTSLQERLHQLLFQIFQGGRHEDSCDGL